MPIAVANEATERDRLPMSLSTAERANVTPASGSGLCLSAPRYMSIQGTHREGCSLRMTGPRADGCIAGLFGQRAVFVQSRALKSSILGSWARPQIPRLERLCQLCATGALGDERHVIFECPELQDIRAQWSHLFQGPETMQAFIWQDDLIGVAKFVNMCLNKVNPPLLGGSASDQPGVAGRDVM